MGGLDYAGTLEAVEVTGLKSANKLPPANALNKGHYYKISIAGDYNVEGEVMTLNAGDWIISNGVKWEVVETLETISSVNGKIGTVELTADDIPETTARKYFSQVEKSKLEGIEAGARNYKITNDIDNETTSAEKLWSSTKISAKLNKKANAIDVYTKTNLQTSEQAQINYANITGAPDMTSYLTEEVDGDVRNELQTISIIGNVITLSDGGTVTLPAAAVGFDGKFTSLTDVPVGLTDGDDNTQLTETQVDEFVANNGYLTEDTNTQLTETQVDEFVANNGYLSQEVDGDVTNEIQTLRISNDTIYLSNGGFTKLPARFSGSYNDLNDKPANIDEDITDDITTSDITDTGSGQIITEAERTTIGTAKVLTKAERDALTNVANGTFVYCTDLGAGQGGLQIKVNAEWVTMSAVLPIIETTTISNINSTSATSGGNITNNDGAEITARGVCWSTSENPTINDAKTEDGMGTGSFTSSITGLTAETTYYVRSYATNSAGTAYGEQINFTTP